MPPKTKARELRRQRTVQLCGFAVELNRSAARRLTENNKITVSAAVLAFSRLPADQQVELCSEARKKHATAAGV